MRLIGAAAVALTLALVLIPTAGLRHDGEARRPGDLPLRHVHMNNYGPSTACTMSFSRVSPGLPSRWLKVDADAPAAICGHSSAATGQ